MIESIRFTRRPVGGPCHATRLGIHWTEPHGLRTSVFHDWCQVCDISDLFDLLVPTPKTEVAHSEWLGPKHEFLAYVLVVPSVQDGVISYDLQARIGVSSQWRDPSAGNVEEEGQPWKSFTERYFAESGPGIYPAPIEEIKAEEALDAL